MQRLNIPANFITNIDKSLKTCLILQCLCNATSIESLLVLERLQTETNKAICRPIAKSFEDQANKFLDDSIEFSNQLIDITKILAEANKFFIIELNTMSRMDPELFERFLKFKRSLIRLIDKVKNSIFYKVVKPQLDELIIEKDEFDEIIYDFQLKTEILPKSSKMSDLMKRLAAQAYENDANVIFLFEQFVSEAGKNQLLVFSILLEDYLRPAGIPGLPDAIVKQDL